jgi:hypothetical protein
MVENYEFASDTHLATLSTPRDLMDMDVFIVTEWDGRSGRPRTADRRTAK